MQAGRATREPRTLAHVQPSPVHCIILRNESFPGLDATAALGPVLSQPCIAAHVVTRNQFGKLQWHSTKCHPRLPMTVPNEPSVMTVCPGPL